MTNALVNLFKKYFQRLITYLVTKKTTWDHNMQKEKGSKTKKIIFGVGFNLHLFEG